MTPNGQVAEWQLTDWGSKIAAMALLTDIVAAADPEHAIL